MLNEKQVSLLRRFIDTFGFPNEFGSVHFCIARKGLSRRDFPEDVPVLHEGALDLLEEMKSEDLVWFYDTRFGEDFDGPCGLDPGTTPWNLTAVQSVYPDSLDVDEWIDMQRS